MEIDWSVVITAAASALGLLGNGGVLTWFLKGYLPRREKEAAEREAGLRADNKEERRAYLAALKAQGERFEQSLESLTLRHREDQAAVHGRLDGIALGLARLETRVKDCLHNLGRGKDVQ